MRSLKLLLALALAFVVVSASVAWAQDTEDSEVHESSESSDQAGESHTRVPGFGGPNQVENQILLEEAEKPLLERWADWKSGLAEKDGFSFGFDYSAVYLGASESPGDDSASSGMFRIFGAWDLIGRESGNTGALVWKMEHRHAYTNVPPGGFGFEIGYAGLITPPFSDAGLILGNMYWRQRLLEGRVAILGGWVDATDYVDVYGLASPWTGFMNFVFSTGSATIPVPNQGLGVAAGGMVTNKLFVIGGLADSNSDPANPGDGFDTFFNDHEYFKHLELGWTPSQDRIYLDNLHLTLWHADEREAALTPSGWGANFSITRYFAKKWYPFLRLGYAEEGGSLLQKSVGAGFGYQAVPGGNLLGFGLNWGEPSEGTLGPNLDSQLTTEIFYRWNIGRELALTPDIQYIKDPALNPEQDSIWVLGLRVRAAF